MKCVHLAHYCKPTIATTDTLFVTGLAGPTGLTGLAGPTGIAERSASALPLCKAGDTLYATDGAAVRRNGTVWTVYSDVELRRTLAAIAVAVVVAVFAHLVLS